jgi:hypothetical protein
MQKFTKFLFFTFCFCSSLFVKANEDYDVYLKYHPLALFNLNRPAIQGSAELVYKKRLGVEYVFGQKYFEFRRNFWKFDPDEVVDVPLGTFHQLELKYYQIVDFGKDHNDYLSVSFGRVRDARNVFVEYSTGLFDETDQFVIRKSIQSIALNYGMIQYITPKVFIEGVLGIGLKRLNNTWEGNTYDPFFDIPKGDLFFWEFEGARVLPQINASFRMSFLIF